MGLCWASFADGPSAWHGSSRHLSAAASFTRRPATCWVCRTFRKEEYGRAVPVGSRRSPWSRPIVCLSICKCMAVASAARATGGARARKTLPFKLPARLAVNRDAHACVDAIVRVIPPPCVRSTSSRGARRRCVPRRARRASSRSAFWITTATRSTRDRSTRYRRRARCDSQRARDARARDGARVSLSDEIHRSGSSTRTQRARTREVRTRRRGRRARRRGRRAREGGRREMRSGRKP